ncbi:MAG TPA: diguanylate cyclase [Roseovarius sp.]|nr:diguanylate cyclase [Roseovarius sp.]
MSGKVLVVDGLATNRIVLKVKLSTAYYDVIQASTGSEALGLAERDMPDIILVSAQLPDQSGAAFLKSLKARCGHDTPPTLLFLTDSSAEARLELLNAGATEILVKPVEERVLLARLRSILRQHQKERDLRMHLTTASEIGFSDSAEPFDMPGKIGLITASPASSLRLQNGLRGLFAHSVVTLDPEGALATPNSDKTPDMYLLRIGAGNLDEMMTLITNLRAASHSRRRPITAVLAADAVDATASIIDIGANDVLNEDQDMRELALRLGRQITATRRAAALRDQFRHSLEAAMIDPLTGLRNRRYALPYLERLIDSAYRDNRGYAVMLADLDYFKQVNDRHGHASGDKVLCHVAQTLRSCLQKNHMIARIGGEEFLMVIPDCDPSLARQLARRICEAVRTSPIHVTQSAPAVAVTISIGATLGHPRPDNTKPDMHVLLEEADRALYQSKVGGRNTVSFCKKTAA